VVSRLQLIGAHVTGRLALRYATVAIPVALVDCEFDEPLELDHATLGAVDLSGCRLPALHADGLQVAGDLTLTGLSGGSVSLFRAEVSGNLWLNAARIAGNEASYAADLAQLQVRGGLYASSIYVTGGLNLWGARADSIELDNAYLASDTGPALRGDGLSVVQDLTCSRLTVPNGGISLFGATIGGQLWLNNADLGNASHWAVNAPQMTVGGGVYGTGLIAHGAMNLFAAVVGASVELPACTLTSDSQNSLRAPGVRIGGSFILDHGAHLEGDVDLSRTEIKEALTFASASFSADTIVDLRRASVGTLNMTTLTASPQAFDLRGASIESIDDEPDSWPSRIALDLFTYRALNLVLPASRRLVWLARGTDGYHPQPYEHLATHYRRLGHDDDARAVLLARHQIRRRTLRPSARFWSYLEDVTVGYGYRPGRALVWLLVLTAVIAVVFTATPPRPAQPSGPTFQAIAFALDILLPVLDLGQEKAFIPVGTSQWVAWVGSLTGWILATTAIAGLTRRLTKP